MEMARDFFGWHAVHCQGAVRPFERDRHPIFGGPLDGNLALFRPGADLLHREHGASGTVEGAWRRHSGGKRLAGGRGADNWFLACAFSLHFSVQSYQREWFRLHGYSSSHFSAAPPKEVIRGHSGSFAVQNFHYRQPPIAAIRVIRA